MNKWTFEALPATWEQGISVLTVEQIRKGVAKVLIDSASDWPPVLSEFIGICKNIGFDFNGCFGRFMGNEKPLNHFERLVFADAVHANVKIKAIGEDERVFKKVFNKWVERFSSGQIPQDVPALPPKSVVMPTDVVRESYGAPDPAKFRQGSIFSRVAQMGRKQNQI
ncbi:hypothetical protein ACN26P_001892 [Vibrio cholerae]|nr:hypothetical protein [Vibrio cholerae]